MDRKAIRPFSLFVLGILLLTAGVPSITAASTSGGITTSVTDPLDAAALMYISGYDVSPTVFYPGETGTVTVYVTNAANTSVFVSQPNLIDSHLKVLNLDTFTTATAVGPGETTEFNFVVTADGTDGTYFPLFTISTNVYGAGAIHSQVKIKIDSTDVRGSISLKPDNFAISKKDIVNVSVVNPRDGDITDVLIVPESDAAQITPAETYVGLVKAGSSAQVPFAITPDKAGTVTFHITYKNADNKHATDVVLPLNLGDDKTGAQIVVNNLESSGTGGTVTLKGDVTNNGLTDAKSVLVTVESPATPVNPNPVYAIGNLEPDDFSSFEVSYTQTAPGKIPIVVTYKDSDGNTFTQRFTYSSNGNGAGTGTGSASSGYSAQGGPSGGPRGGMFGSFGSGLNQVPVIPIIAILVALVALLVAWKKGLLKPITDRFHKKSDDDDELQKEH